MARLILASNRLPVRIDADNRPVRTAGGLASALEGADLGDESIWVGWPGIESENIDDEAELRAALRSIGAQPVLLTAAELEGFYDGYANGTLWPVLHYMVDRAQFDRSWFEQYRIVNEKYARAILAIAEPGDTVWIHDYHLFLLPALLRDADRQLRIGFFLHTPFPSSELFRVVPQRRELLRGLLGADLIGFHTYDYLRHFRSALLRSLGIESDVGSLTHEGRTIQIGVHPIGHNHVGFDAAMRQNAFDEALEQHDASLDGRHLILSVERLDYTKGVPQKLAAIRMFLERHSELRNQVAFILIAVPSRVGMNAYDELTEDVQREVGAINGVFGSVGHAPVQFLHRSFPPTELAALYARADVCLVTPLIDGMNLVAKEFVACKRDLPGSKPGALVLSEFAGAAAEMSQAIQVNPYDVEGVADAIAEAIEMPDRLKRARTTAMQERLIRQHSGTWARVFLEELASTAVAGGKPATGSLHDLATRLAQRVRSGQGVALFLDYDGTLRDFVDDPEDAVPDPELGPLLARLAATEGVQVAVVSGRESRFLERHFADLGLALVAEHGYAWWRPSHPEWALVDDRVDTTWKHHVLPLLEHATNLTPGSRIEPKRSAIVWHYRQADPEFGQWRARGLLSQLTDITASLPVSVHHGQNIVEIASQLVNKGVAVHHLLEAWQPDAALVAGDDQTDETMFSLEPEGVEFHSVHVGKGSTRAGTRTTREGLRGFLEHFDAALRE